MKFVFKILLWIVMLGLLGYGAWYAYENWWGTGDTGTFIETTSKNIEDAARSKANEIGTNVARGTFSNIKTFLGDTVGTLLSGAGEAIQNAGTGLQGTSPTTVNTTYVQTAPLFTSGSAPEPTSTSFYVPPPPATIMTKIATPLSFSINSGSSYNVDWGDGTAADNGAMEGNKVAVINHVWNKEGDYTVQMTIGENGSTTTFSFPVRVYQ